MVKLHQYLCFNLGDFAGMQRIAEAALGASADVAWLHGMLAFAHEQNHRLREAEASARRALSLSEREPWAQHAIAHVMLTEGRIDEGIAFLDGVRHHWTDLNSFMLTHLWWHQALFYLEQSRIDDALTLYDRECWGVEKTYSQDQIGAVSLLARFEFAGIDVGSRWRDLGPYLAARQADIAQPFLSLQYLYGLAKAGRPEAETLLAAIRAAPLAGPRASRRVWADIGVPLAEGLVAHVGGRAEAALAAIEPNLGRLAEIGGSHAQRDLFDQIVLDCLLHAGHWLRAQQILETRRLADPAGVPVNRALGDVYERLGLPALAAEARARLLRA
jgi:tetratricopeptide (TPR) repeat protein